MDAIRRGLASLVALLLLVAAVPIVSGCGSAKHAMEAAEPTAAMAAAPPAGPVSAPAEEGEMAPSEPAPVPLASDDAAVRALVASPPPAPQRPSPQAAPDGAKAEPAGARAIAAPMLIYTAQLSMAVFEVAASLSRVEAIAREVGGYLGRRDDRAITVRVPVARFDEALRAIEGLGDVLSRNVSTQDVTEEYHDLEVRLRNLRAVRDRIEQLLAKATKVEDSLMIERELNRVAAEIDRIEGRLKFLRDRAAYSTITVTFAPRTKETVRKGPFQLPVPWLHELGIARLLDL